MHRKIIKVLILYFAISPDISILAQNSVINGKVLDLNTHQPLAGVNIYVKDLNIGTYSDISGKFQISILDLDQNAIIVFQHIGYDTLELTVTKLFLQDEVLLQSRLIPTATIIVEAEAEKMNIRKDLPQPVSVIYSKQFEMKGYIDAGDLLRTDNSIQVEEELSGQKTVAIRGGNSDEVVVLYNGIKMNNVYNNVFDLSLIDLTDLKRLEVIKGSNTSLYGPEAFSGVINIVPKYKHDYHIRFQQRFGTYASGNWGIHLFHKYNNMYGNFSFKQGGAVRTLASDSDNDLLLENKSEHYTGNFTYNFSENAAGDAIRSLNIMYIRTRLDYENELINESLLNYNQVLSSRYENNIFDFTVSSAYQWMDETQHLLSSGYLIEKDIENRSVYFNLEKSFNVYLFDMLFSYQYKNSDLSFIDDRSDLNEVPYGINDAKLNRQHHGVASVIKFKAPTGSDDIQFIDFDLSVRYDNILDKQIKANLRDSTLLIEDYSFNLFKEKKWDKLTTKFSTYFGGGSNTFVYNLYLNIGTNIKFPTLYQQISVPQSIDLLPNHDPILKPEKNQSYEIGLVMMRELRKKQGIYGWQINANYFQNSYENKFRHYYIPGFPVSFYDNVKVAKISGFECTPALYLLNKKITLELGISKYFISEKAAFPFKYDFKRTLNVTLDHEGYSFQVFWFKEGEQYGWIRNPEGRLSEIILPEFNNIDIHLSKSFSIYSIKLFLNISARNILNDDFELNGLALRDRRFYVTFGAQY